MRLPKILSWPSRAFRNIPVGGKLALTFVGSLAMLSGVSWFALDRLIAIGALQDDLAMQATLERKAQQGMAAELELRVISRELPVQQTVTAIDRVTERADNATATARDSLLRARRSATAASDQQLLTEALARLDDTSAAVKRAAALRADMVTVRQKRLFQSQQIFETGTDTFAQEIARGGATPGGVASVRASGAPALANEHDPTFEAFNTYRLAMARLHAAAVMFMATGNGSAANEVREETQEAASAMALILNSDIPEPLKVTARTIDSIGTGIGRAASELVDQTRRLDAMGRTEVEASSQAMHKAIGDLVRSAAAREDQAGEQARQGRAAAVRDMIVLVGAIAAAMLTVGTVMTHLIAAPLRGLTRGLRSMAAGDTSVRIGYGGRRDEIGQMAAAVETLRGVMRQAFVQSQIIEQSPVPVMTAAAGGDFPVTYLNPAARQVLDLIKDHLPVSPAQVLGHSLDIFHADPQAERARLADPARLPHRTRITLGAETLECTASAIFDRHGLYVGPMIVWQVLSAQTRLAARFEDSVGAIAAVVGESADAMKQAAVMMTEAVGDSGQRLTAVTGASEQASGHVSAAAAGAEELALSVAEISRQVAESARISGQAVREAEATDRCVSGLNAAAERIGDVVRLIGDIAARTNLLALNATIEAARAGDAGKGFAVVASEVKTLATQTAKATREIADQIGTMQQSADQAVGALRGIGATILRMNEIATAIAGAVEEQGAATQDIARAVQQAAAGSHAVYDNIAVVSQAVGDTGTQSGAVLRAATRLSEQAVTLKADVRSFLASVREAT